jgi:hypothetical protein
VPEAENEKVDQPQTDERQVGHEHGAHFQLPWMRQS